MNETNPLPFSKHYMKISPNLFQQRNNQRKGQELRLPEMPTSQKTLSAQLHRKTLLLSKKIKFLDYKKSNPLTEIFNIGKISAATIIKMKRRFTKIAAVLNVTGTKFVRKNLTN